MLSFVFNAIAVVVGTIIGVLFKNKIKKETSVVHMKLI